MAKRNLYEITVERKVRDKYTVVARSRTEAAVAFASPDFQSVNDVEHEQIDERVLTPKLIDEDLDQMRIDEILDASEAASDDDAD